MDQREQRAVDLGQQLIEELAQLNHNRKNLTGDRAMPRKRRSGAAQAGNNEEVLAERLSIRRGILALVEVGKAVSIFWTFLCTCSACKPHAQYLRERAVPLLSLLSVAGKEHDPPGRRQLIHCRSI